MSEITALRMGGGNWRILELAALSVSSNGLSSEFRERPRLKKIRQKLGMVVHASNPSSTQEAGGYL